MKEIDDLTLAPYDDRHRERVEALLLRYRAAAGLDTYPTPWRLRLLLNSRVWDHGRDTRIWLDAAGEARGLALLWRRRPADPTVFLERLIDPALRTQALVEAMLAWGAERACLLAAELDVPLTLYASRLVPADGDEGALAHYGFVPLEPDRDACTLYMACPLHDALSASALPPGYSVRRLRTGEEVTAYDRLYDFGGVSLKHRLEMLGSDECALLAVVDPQGVFVAYGEVSICRREWAQGGRRLGWVDHIGTRPQDRGRGFGRAIVLASLGQLQALGAETALLQTTSTNGAALRLYETSGFERLPLPQPPGYARPVQAEG